MAARTEQCPGCFNPKTGIVTADNADDTDGKGFPIRAAEIIPPRCFVSKLSPICAIRVIRGHNFGIQVKFSDDIARREQVLELLRTERRKFRDRLPDCCWVKRVHRRE